MSADYDHGRRDGLRLALAILATEEEKWAPLLGESRSWRTNKDREVRHKALQVAQRRVQTALNRLAPGESEATDAELAAALARLGLWPPFNGPPQIADNAPRELQLWDDAPLLGQAPTRCPAHAPERISHVRQ